MKLLRLSGHAGAGKSRLTRALIKRGISLPRVILYTSRPARDGEFHGKDYYFLSWAAIEALPERDFFRGVVGEKMIQAVDLIQLEKELKLKSNELVFIEIFADLWIPLKERIFSRIGEFPTISVFMTAIDPDYLKSLVSNEARGEYIEKEVGRILEWRNKSTDTPDEIKRRAKSAVKEILDAIGPDGDKLYDKVFHSAPEGPDHEDEWTKEEKPVGRALIVLDEFVQFAGL